MKKRTINFTKITSTLALTFIFTACGNDDPTDQLTITPDNQATVSAIVFDSIDGATPAMPASNMTTTTSSLSKLLPNYAAIQTPLSSDASFECSGGGDIYCTADTTTYNG